MSILRLSQKSRASTHKLDTFLYLAPLDLKTLVNHKLQLHK